METQVNDVFIDPEDVHCGHIYLHEPSMMLKYCCIFCQKIFDDINYYCNHLTEHVDAVTIMKEEDLTEDDKGLIVGVGQEENSNCFIAVGEIPAIGSAPLTENDNHYIAEVDNVENIGQVSVENTENSCSDEFYGYTEEELDDDEEESRQFLFENNYAECDEEDINNKDDILLNDPNTELERTITSYDPEKNIVNSVIDNNQMEYGEECDNKTNLEAAIEDNMPSVINDVIKKIEILNAEIETTSMNKDDKEKMEILNTYAKKASLNKDVIRNVNISNVVDDVVKVKIEDYPTQMPADGSEEPLDFENLIGNAKIIKPTKTVCPGFVPSPEIVDPAPSVKTFKIITLKNQIEELYSMVNQAREDGSIIEEIKKHTIGSLKKGIERTTKIIGETVISSRPVEINVERSAEKDMDEYKCHACDKVFRNQHSLSLHGRAHYMESHSDVKVAHRCTECNELFNKLKDLQFHIQKVHYPDGLKCRLCHKVLRSIGLLEVHMRKMHLQQTSFRCRFCGLMTFNSIEDFEEHSRSHGKDDKFKCYICGRQYTIEGNLRQHVLRHSIGKGDRCVVCGKVTQRLTQHMKIHSPRPTRLLQCSICNKTFSFSSALSRHTKVMHKLPRTIRAKIVRNENTNPTKRRRKPRKRHVDNNGQITHTTEKEIKREPDQEVAVEEDDDIGAEKKVIVEMIENVMNRRTLMEDDIFDDMDCTVACYETIAAVHSITSPTDS